MRTIARLSFALALAASAPFVVVACDGGSSNSSKFPGTEEGAKQMLGEFLKPGADHAALSKPLRATKDDYKAVYGADSADKLASVYDPAWDKGEVVLKPNDGQTELKLWSATSEDLKNGTGNAADFPGGYKKVADKLQPGLTLYRFKFVKPGEDLGMAFDGLVFVNGHWVLIPKPWRALGGE